MFSQTPLKLHGPVVTVVLGERLCSDRTQTESCLFFIHPARENFFSSEHDLKSEPSLLDVQWKTLQPPSPRRYCRPPLIALWTLSYFMGVSRDGPGCGRSCFHYGRVVFVLRAEEGLLIQRYEDLPDKFFSQVTK